MCAPHKLSIFRMQYECTVYMEMNYPSLKRTYHTFKVSNLTVQIIYRDESLTWQLLNKEGNSVILYVLVNAILESFSYF